MLEPIYEATKLLSGSSYPTQGDLRMAFTIIIDMLESKMDENPPTTQSLVATAMNSKLTDYWTYLNKSSTISAIIDPSHKLGTFENINEIEETIELEGVNDNELEVENVIDLSTSLLMIFRIEFCPEYLIIRRVY